ncbi:MAG TPA: dienelactone hydrolase family protein [Bryobacteraceae bacterium]|nr:dienelactone hydrolase family protein [Bryobacteraceae bacterium]
MCSAKLWTGLLLIASAGSAQSLVPGPQVLTFLSEVDDTDQPYGLYLPKNYDPQRPYPLVISLHGAYSNHRLNLRRVFGKGNRASESDAEATRYWPALRDVEYIVASPLARGTMGYKGVAEKDVYDVLADVKKRFSIDEDRVYLTGLSMGGGGSLWLGLTRPDIWAAIAPVCPAATADTNELARNGLHMPFKIFQGESDPVVPATETRRWHKRLLEAGVKSTYVEYPGIRHNSWDVAYKDGAIFDWFAQFRRVRFPEHVTFAARSYKHGSAYWVRFDGLTPGALATIDARFTAKRRLTIKTDGLDAFTLTLKGHPMIVGTGLLRLSVDGVDLQTRAADSVSISKGAKGWMLKPAVASGKVKRLGAEGPIADAVAQRHIYVYGTGATSDSDEVQRRRAIAQQAAEWSTSKLKLLLTFRVLADREVQSVDLQNANLMLFGTKETNSLIGKYSNELPMELNAGAADYGLLYVYPVDGRYVVIHSGLPWWTRFDQTDRFELPFLKTPKHTLTTLGDYVVFRGGLDNVLAEGRFDRNWKLPADAAAKVRGIGAIEVR